MNSDTGVFERQMYIGKWIDKDKVRADAHKRANDSHKPERVRVHHHAYGQTCNVNCEVFAKKEDSDE